MKAESKIFCVIYLAGFMFLNGCAKNELVKKDEPVAPSAATAGKTKIDAKTGEAKSGSSSKPMTQAQLKESDHHDKLEPIPNAAELKAVLEKIYFDFDEYTLSQTARDALKKNAELLKNEPNLSVQIEGNCDERGSDEYNLALGERRAKAAMQYLVTMGIPENRLAIISYGKEKPVATGHDESAWSKNRRDEFVITSK